MKQSGIYSLSVLLVLAALPIRADACSCMAFPDDPATAAEIAFNRADVVFLGTALATENKLTGVPRVRITEFTVEKSWKGLDGATLAEVRTAASSAACGTRFADGARYIVFANWDSDRETLTTSLCDLNRRMKEAADIATALDHLAARSNPSMP